MMEEERIWRVYATIKICIHKTFGKNTFNRSIHLYTENKNICKVEQLQGGPTEVYICIQVKNYIASN